MLQKLSADGRFARLKTKRFICLCYKNLPWCLVIFFVFIRQSLSFYQVVEIELYNVKSFLHLNVKKQRISHFWYSGLLSEKPDDTLFFLDVGQPKKTEQKGKYVVTQLNCLHCAVFLKSPHVN